VAAPPAVTRVAATTHGRGPWQLAQNTHAGEVVTCCGVCFIRCVLLVLVPGEVSSSSLHFQLRTARRLHEYTSQAALEHTQATTTHAGPANHHPPNTCTCAQTDYTPCVTCTRHALVDQLASRVAPGIDMAVVLLSTSVKLHVVCRKPAIWCGLSPSCKRVPGGASGVTGSRQPFTACPT
jgi:hypothetical protein